MGLLLQKDVAVIESATLLELIYRLTRWALGGLFVYAGIMKLTSPRTFATLIDAFGLLPGFLLLPVAIGLPVLEVLAGVGLIMDVKGSLSTVAGLILLFIALLGYGVWLGLDIDCGCFGPGDPEAEAFDGLKPALIRDLSIIIPLAYLFAWRRCRRIRPVKAGLMMGKLLAANGQSSADYEERRMDNASM